jgi:predicted membrane chloride channel (bestrophin family)
MDITTLMLLNAEMVCQEFSLASIIFLVCVRIQVTEFKLRGFELQTFLIFVNGCNWKRYKEKRHSLNDLKKCLTQNFSSLQDQSHDNLMSCTLMLIFWYYLYNCIILNTESFLSGES